MNVCICVLVVTQRWGAATCERSLSTHFSLFLIRELTHLNRVLLLLLLLLLLLCWRVTAALHRWVDLFRQFGPLNAPGVLLGNKSDLRNHCQVRDGRIHVRHVKKSFVDWWRT